MSEFFVENSKKKSNNILDTDNNSFYVDKSRELNLLTQIRDISKKIQEISTNRLKLAKYLKLINHPVIAASKFSQELNISKQNIFYEIQKNNLHGLTIAGVDGGLVKGSFTGINIAAYRAIGVVFKFGREDILKNYYFPNKEPQINLKSNLAPMSNIEWDQVSSLLRANCELKLAIDLIEQKSKSKIDFLLMDGSFKDIQINRIKHINSRILTKLKSEYSRLLQNLINKSNEKGINLAWIVKDSKIRDFVSVISSIIPELSNDMHEILSIDPIQITKNLNDQLLMNYLLSIYQRSFIITKNENSYSNHSVSDYQNFSFYLKVVPYDIPLRIDFSVPKNKPISSEIVFSTANKLSSIICPLSNISSEYSLPSPLIEADARAKISQDKFSSIIELIQNDVPGNFEIKHLKRSRSPFNFK